MSTKILEEVAKAEEAIRKTKKVWGMPHDPAPQGPITAKDMKPAVERLERIVTTRLSEGELAMSKLGAWTASMAVTTVNTNMRIVAAASPRASARRKLARK